MDTVDPFVEKLHSLGLDDAKVRIVEKVALDMARSLGLTREQAQQKILLVLAYRRDGNDG